MLTESFLRYGQPEPPLELIPLRAGPLTMHYDPTNGMVRRIRLGEVEVLRGIYAAVRDHNWGTVPGTMREISRRIGERSFHIEFESEHRQGDIHFAWRGVIQGDESGTLRYEFDGWVKESFLRNRIGFCVLHPIRECAGARARQLRIDGSEIDSSFPALIEPQIFGQSSFRELRQMAHEVKPGLWAEVNFEGDTFEMEDQRNWTDASFKTYCTPLTLPFPVAVKTGDSIRQAVTLKLVGDLPVAGAAVVTITENPIRLSFSESTIQKIPAVGLGLASHGEALSEAEINSLKILRPAHLRVDVRIGERDSVATLQRAINEAEQLDAGLELALHLPRQGEAEASDLLRALNQGIVPVNRILALREGERATSSGTMVWVRKHFGILKVPIGAGSDCNFCELNREHALGRLALPDADFLFWSINPQVHAIDHLSVMETLEAQAATVVSARAFAGDRLLVVSPITLKQRFNPVATGPDTPTAPGELPPQVDTRQLSNFAAAWTLGSLASLIAAEVDSFTYYETTGWRGVIERAQGARLPARFPSTPGQTFPLFEVFAEVAGFNHAAIAHSSSPSQVAALRLHNKEQGERVLVANLTPVSQVVVFDELKGARSPLQLKPYESAKF